MQTNQEHDGNSNAPVDLPRIGEDRAELLNRIRTSLGRTHTREAPPEPPVVDESIIRLACSDDDLITVFTENAEAVGMEVCRLKLQALPDELKKIYAEWQIKCVAVSIKDGNLRTTVNTHLSAAKLENVAWQEATNLDAHFTVDLGITDVEAALADSGSIVLRSGPEQSRGTFLIPPIHLAILAASQILPDMIDYWPIFRESEDEAPAAATVFVTGPSKTADIEGILITGVHGPGKVRILLLEDA